jgi:hypothetical protein
VGVFCISFIYTSIFLLYCFASSKIVSTHLRRTSVAEQSSRTEEKDTLLNFPLAAFFRSEFVKAVAEKAGNSFITTVPENALMSIVGFMCAEPARSSKLKQPTVGDFIALTRAQFKSFRGFGGYDSRAKAVEGYLAIFGLAFAEVEAQNVDLDAAEIKLLASIGKPAD